MVKPEKGRMVEELLIRMARTGQLRGKVDENQLIDLLGEINQQQAQTASKIQVRQVRNPMLKN